MAPAGRRQECRRGDAGPLAHVRRQGPRPPQDPFGHQLKTGEVMYLDIKEGAEFGGGPHGMLIGTTGSGKSEFLRTLILSLVAMHHPDQVNLLLTDFKGGSTFLGMENLPHTAAVITNMAEEAELVGRMGEVLTGELDRRQNLLRQAGIQVGATGALSGVAEYEKYRERGADLKPLPTLFVVVDEFAELLQSHPDFVALFDRICEWGARCGSICCSPPSRCRPEGRASTNWSPTSRTGSRCALPAPMNPSR